MKQFLLLLFLMTTIGGQAQKHIILYDACESLPGINWTGSFDKWQYFQGNIKPEITGIMNSGTSKLAVSDSFSRKGKTSYRFSIEKDSTYGRTGLTATSRSELVWNINSGNKTSGVRWVSASILIPLWFTDDATPDGVLFNSIPAPYDYPTPMFMYILKGRWVIEGNDITDSGKLGQKYLLDLGAVEKGIWTDWILNRNFTQKDSGFIKLYKNGKLVFERKGGNWIEKNHNAEMHMPLGIYKWPWLDSLGEGRGASLVNDKRAVYYDEIRFGNSEGKLADFIVVPDSIKNVAPAINAGNNFSINLPKNTATLRGSASDSDGIITGIMWKQISGDTSVKIVNDRELSTTLLNLKIGQYRFQFSAVDNSGIVVHDEVVLTVLPALPNTKQGIFFYDDCENEPEVQPLSEWNQFPLTRWSYFSGNGNDVYDKSGKAKILVSAEYSRAGKKSYKVSVTKNPTYNPVVFRAELSWNQPSTKFIGINWMSASLLIPRTWVDDCTPVSVLFNTKAIPDNYSTPFRLEILKDKYRAVVANISSDGKILGELATDLGVVKKGEWTDWALNRNFTQADTGYMRLYKNGVMVWERLGPNWINGPGRSEEAYIYHGLYKWTWSDSTGMGWGFPCFNGTIEAYYDEFKFGGYGADPSDFLRFDSSANTGVHPLSSAGTPVVFDKRQGQLLQSPVGEWHSLKQETYAVSSSQILTGNGFVETLFTDTLGVSGVVMLDNDSSLHSILAKDSTGEDDLIWIVRNGSKFIVGDYVKGKQIIKTLLPVVLPNSLVRIKRVGKAFIAQTFTTTSGWINLYTFEYQSSDQMWIKIEFKGDGHIRYPILGK